MLIEALKKRKFLVKKAEDYIKLVRDNCAIPSTEKPKFGTEDEQRIQIQAWIQGHSDILKEISKLNIAIQKTNLDTNLTIQLQGKAVTKCLSEWILRARELSSLEMRMWDCITDRSIKETLIPGPTRESQPIEVKIIRFYDPKLREVQRMALLEEPSIVTGSLEIANATTTLIGYDE
jgi:hypothetical protein